MSMLLAIAVTIAVGILAGGCILGGAYFLEYSEYLPMMLLFVSAGLIICLIIAAWTGW